MGAQATTSSRGADSGVGGRWRTCSKLTAPFWRDYVFRQFGKSPDSRLVQTTGEVADVTGEALEVVMTLTQIRTRLGRLRNPCRTGHVWTELASPPACRVCGRTQIDSR